MPRSNVCTNLIKVNGGGGIVTHIGGQQGNIMAQLSTLIGRKRVEIGICTRIATWTYYHNGYTYRQSKWVDWNLVAQGDPCPTFVTNDYASTEPDKK